MKKYFTQSKVNELIFQLLLHLMVFVFFAYDKRIEGVDFKQFYFFLNLVIAAFVINYVLLPKFLYQNRYWELVVSIVVILGMVIVVEEFFLEQVFYPETRGQKFSKIFYTLLGVLPTISILVGFKFAWDALVKQREVLELKNSVKESELLYLKSQINPHFLFNNINNLYSYAVMESPKTPEIILELSSVLRYMLYECKERYVPLEKEINHLEHYINLSKLQIEGRGEVNLQIENLGPSFDIAPLILTVFVENAFKHSSSSQTNAIEIDIDLKIDEKGVLNFKCKNTFLEISNTDSLGSGIGLLNVRKRLELVYPERHNLEISVDNNYYSVDLMVELKD
ncbi:sensor histidine kinase [Flavicella marina]|uniref:sensor histidine kinase n=1 Tax=Flavicella marina TaxID=1475951 RepID=UPI0012658A55|nr:histidine kinase [Flavicella marina]